MSDRPTRLLLERAMDETRRAAVTRIWQAIQKKAPAPERLTDPVGVTWLDLMHMLEAEGLRHGD